MKRVGLAFCLVFVTFSFSHTHTDAVVQYVPQRESQFVVSTIVPSPTPTTALKVVPGLKKTVDVELIATLTPTITPPTQTPTLPTPTTSTNSTITPVATDSPEVITPTETTEQSTITQAPPVDNDQQGIAFKEAVGIGLIILLLLVILGQNLIPKIKKEDTNN